MWMLILGVALGATVGGVMGMGRSCETGACPLTSNPYIGAIYGGVMGFMIASLLNNPARASRPAEEETQTMQTTHNANITEISTLEEYQSKVLKSSVPVLVDFWAPWCAPCRAQAPILGAVADQAGERAEVVQVNVDDAPDLARELQVASIPTLVLFQDGKEVRRFVGVQSAKTLSGALGL